jgi:hypothetical protein
MPNPDTPEPNRAIKNLSKSTFLARKSTNWQKKRAEPPKYTTIYPGEYKQDIFNSRDHKD